MTRTLMISIFAFLSPIAFAYDPVNHEDISTASAGRSVLNDSANFSRLRLIGYSVAKGNNKKFPNSNSAPSNLYDLIRFGSSFEDHRRGLQVFYHFYDPANGGRKRTLSGVIGAVTSPFGAPSPQWALEDDADFGTEQPFSHKKAMQYFYDALTKPTQAADGVWLLASMSGDDDA